MHKIYIENMGPIDKCEIEINDFVVLTGAQASGKSTIAKAIFLFRTIRDDIIDLIAQRSGNSLNTLSLRDIITRHIRNKFLQVFGISKALDSNLYMRYEFNPETSVSIKLNIMWQEDRYMGDQIWITFSKNIVDFLNRNEKTDISDSTTRKTIISELNLLFSDDSETIFIPAGRSLISLLTTQLNYIFTTMSEDQKRSIDFCTQKYIERILKIRHAFSDGISGYLESKRSTSTQPFDAKKCREAILLIDKILKGKYIFSEGQEQLQIDNSGRFVKINYTSSGQQESVWIFNLLIYQLINNQKTFLIVEEPEAHLYPDAQKNIAELLSLFGGAGNSVMITTHSPYILGALNNLLFAASLSANANSEAVNDVIAKSLQLESCDAYFVENGSIRNCFDCSYGLIANEVIDGASHTINEAFDKLVQIESEGLQ